MYCDPKILGHGPPMSLPEHYMLKLLIYGLSSIFYAQVDVRVLVWRDWQACGLGVPSIAGAEWHVRARVGSGRGQWVALARDARRTTQE